MATVAESYKILWVDDDEQVIASAKRLARNQPWTIVGAHDAEIARMLVTAQMFAVVIADHRLARYGDGQSGTDLLEYAKEKAPATSRILITGAIGKEVIEDAVNRAHVFRFIAKPWDNAQILVDISKAIEHHQLKNCRIKFAARSEYPEPQARAADFGPRTTCNRTYDQCRGE